MKYVLGIDLHGTLLDDEWEIKENIKGKLISSLKSINNFCSVYICSGNDLAFVKKYIPEEILRSFEGYVLETGCVISDGNKEEIIIPKNLIKDIKKLENILRNKNFEEVKYFARRLTTISLFTKTVTGGSDPAEFYPKVKETVKKLGYSKKVHVTHSSVAVDIIPRGHNKFSGIKHIAKGLETIGIADSLNDIHLINNADYSFIPANVSPGLLRELKEKGKNIINMEETSRTGKEVVLQSRYKTTKAVVEILEFINKNLSY